MKPDFQISLAFVLEWEGGFSDDPADPGGRTNLGIEEREYRNFFNDQSLDVRNITHAQAEQIYKASYWDAIHGDYVAMPLCMVLFDTAVNSGPGRAYKWLNEALGLPVEGWQQSTSNAYHKLDQAGVVAVANAVIHERRVYDQNLPNINPNLSKFVQGWMNRIDALKKASGLS